jgi:2-keto-4-pentenoate hydratase
MTSVSSAAAFLDDLRARPHAIHALPTDLQPNDLTTAYQIQDALVNRLLERNGGQCIGYKAACTSLLAQQQLNVPGPLFGQLLSFSTQPQPATFDASGHLVSIIELEFGVRIGVAPPRTSVPYTAATIAPFISAVLPAIEIVSHRFVDWTKAGALAIAADNAIHGAWVHGAPCTDWRDLDLAAHEATLSVNGAAFCRGQGKNALGSPLNVAAWLANQLPIFGRQLKAGDYITTGVVCDVYMAQRGDVIEADFGVIGRVELTIR